MNILLNTIPDFTTKDMQILKESVNGMSTTKIRGPYIMCEQKNRNGRIYPKPLIEREVDRFIREFVEPKSAIMELNHPTDPKRMFEVDLERGCGLIESLEWDGDNVIGTSRVLENHPMGRILKAYLDEGITLGVSTRASGSVGQNSVVNEDLKLITIDNVHLPSAQVSYVECIRENYNYIIGDGSTLVESAIIQFEKELADNRNNVKYAFKDLINSIRMTKGLSV